MICKKRQSSSDHVMKTVTNTLVAALSDPIYVGSIFLKIPRRIVSPVTDVTSVPWDKGTSVASLTLWVIVNKSAVKWSKQRTESLLMQSGTSLKIKFIDPFLTLGSEGRQRKHCFPHKLALQSILLFSEPSLSFCFCVDLHIRLSGKHCVNLWVGLNRQWCWSSSA